MSVYIKGMEMPVSCTRCPLSDDDVVFCHSAKKYIPMLGHPTFCPLIEVPDHGRLIDADVLEEMCDNPFWCVWLGDIRNAPTVIMGEEHGDGK